MSRVAIQSGAQNTGPSSTHPAARIASAVVQLVT
jgi:hypothetical protein